MYIERLPSGMYAVFRDDGVRVAVKQTKQAAERYKNRLLRKRRGKQ